MKPEYNLIIVIIFLSILVGVGGLVYIYDTQYKPVIINNTKYDTIPSEKYIDNPERELPFIVEKTFNLNKTHICFNEKNIYTCELYEDYKGNIPFNYSNINSYQVKFINQEVYIINENLKTNPSISSINIQHY